MTRSQLLTALITTPGYLLETANAAEQAYAKATNGKFDPITADQVDRIQNNIPVARAVLNASLALVVMRGHDGDQARVKAITDIAEWNLSADEKTVVRLFTNATWWVRNANRDFARTARPICKDYGQLLEEADAGDSTAQGEVVKDDVLLQAVAAVTLQKLNG